MLVEIVFGVNIVEIVTSGLYPNSHDIFREYIQNSCDAIDDAIKAGTLQNDAGEVSIEIDAKERRISIEDNGIGISGGEKNFVRIMSSIGNSDKSLKTDRGFRGIGRLGGLAYCKKLIFSTKVAGEKKISTLTINAEKLRETFFSKNKFFAEQVLSANMTFATLDAENDEHFFKVELLDVTNDDLLDVKAIREYLSFVAPVTYSPQFSFQQQIYEHAAKLDKPITEYKIWLNDEPIVKNYKDNFKTKLGADEIFDVYFRDFRDEANNLIAWSWIGLSMFKGVMTKSNVNQMRCIRLRQKNIQIGDENVLQKLFSEDRGTTYFIGEVHAVDTNLRPNSRRDYFEENDACKFFEESLQKYFKELARLCHNASDIRNAFKATAQPQNRKHEIERHTLEYQETHKAEHDAELAALNKKATEKQAFIDQERQAAKDNPDAITSRVFKEIEANAPSLPDPDSTITPPPLPLQHWSKETKKLYEDIYEIILANPLLKGEALLDKIKEVLAK